MPAHSLILHSLEEWHSFFNQQLEKYSSVVLLCDSNTSAHCLERFTSIYLNHSHLPLHTVIIEPGEAQKVLSTAERVWDEMITKGIDRNGVLIALGGGVISDLGGVIASAYKRGIAQINVPTTHLAMTDAAIGGKNAVNFNGVKNQIGFVHFPEAVLIDPAFLSTLPSKELMSGWMETVKHALISDLQLWNEIIEMDPLSAAMNAQIIHKSASIKTKISDQDPDDRGIRQALNFGHTIGHAIEAQGGLLHGEAVALGTIAETLLSSEKVHLEANACQQIVDYLLSHYREHLQGVQIDLNQLEKAMINDKKTSKGILRFSLIPNIGEIRVGCSVESHEAIKAVQSAIELVQT